jgi:hypothetical protein
MDGTVELRALVHPMGRVFEQDVGERQPRLLH